MLDIKKLPTDITHHILKFRDFLVNSFSSVDSLMDKHDWDGDGRFQVDWIQVNWELLVERELLGPGRYLTSPFIPQGNRQMLRSGKQEFYVSVEITNIPNEVPKELADSMRLLASCNVCRFAGYYTAIRGGYGFYPPLDTATVYSEDTHYHFNIPFVYLRFSLERIDY